MLTRKSQRPALNWRRRNPPVSKARTHPRRNRADRKNSGRTKIRDHVSSRKSGVAPYPPPARRRPVFCSRRRGKTSKLRSFPSKLLGKRFEAPVKSFEGPVICFEGPVIYFEAPGKRFEGRVIYFEARVKRFEAPVISFEAFVIFFEAFVSRSAFAAQNRHCRLFSDPTPRQCMRIFAADVIGGKFLRCVLP